MQRFLWPLLLLAAGCAAPPREQPAPEPTPAPVERPAAPAAPGEAWNVAGSRLELRVYREGPMQKLGHNHLIVSDALAGEVWLREPVTESDFTLSLPLESLVVDDPAARAAAGGEFAAPVPEKDREATRRNMLGGELLDAARQGEMRLMSESISGGAEGYTARVRVSLAGKEHVVTAPFTLEQEGASLVASASFPLTHAQLGLEPFTVALGALRVRDVFEVRLELKARRSS